MEGIMSSERNKKDAKKYLKMEENRIMMTKDCYCNECCNFNLKSVEDVKGSSDCVRSGSFVQIEHFQQKSF